MSPKTPRSRRRVALALVATSLAAGALAPSAMADTPKLDLEHLSGAQLEKMLQDGSLTSVQLTQAYIDRIDAINKRGPGINAVTQFNKDALVDAALTDKERAAGIDLGPAMGLPILLKDIIDAKGEYTSAGNYSLRNSFPAEDSGVAKKLREHGVVILGKAGLSEWANSFGSNPSGFGNLTGQVLNAIDADQNPSGSSSGSAASAAASLSALTIGTETSGSIISPSQTQSLVGLRPTVGLVPGQGIAPILASQDTAGPIERTVSDAAITLQSIAGHDDEADAEYDAVFGPDWKTNGDVPPAPATVPDYTSALSLDFVKGKRIGYVGDPTVAGSTLKTAFDALTAAGAIMVKAPTQVTGSVAAFPIPANYEAHKTIDTYYAHLGPDVPIKSLEDEVADNLANSQESLKFGNATHLAESKTDISAGGANETQFRADLPQRKAVYHKSIDDMLNFGTPNDPSDDLIGIIGSISNGPTAGYPQITIPLGYVATTRRTQNVSVNGGAYSERDLLGIGYVIEQATKARKTPGEVDPSMYRCAKTAVPEPFAERDDCNPDYDSIMAAVGTRPNLGFSLETESAQSLQSRLKAGTLSSEDLTKAYLARIALSNAEGPATQAVREVNLDAIAQAKALDAKRATDGAGGPLYGIPVLVDDSIDVAGTPTTAGSVALQNSVPAADAKLIAKLKAGGAIILGKTNVTELNGVFDSNIPEGYSSLGGQVLLPSDTDRTPAGSSAGSAAATSSGLAAVTVGLETSTDTAQLIAPAGNAGVVGLKPTVGLVSRTGVLGVAKSQDSPGPIAKTVYDAAAALQVISGRDAADSATTAAPTGNDYLTGLKTTALKGKRIAVLASTTTPYPDAITAVQGAGATTAVTAQPTTATTAPSIISREFKRDLNAYLGAGHTGGASTLQGIIDYAKAHSDEALKYQNGTGSTADSPAGDLATAQATADVTDGTSAAGTTYASDRDTGRTASQATIDGILNNGTPADTTDDSDVVMVPSGNALVNIADRAGYPVLTVPAGYGTGATGRDPIGVTFIGTAYSEARLLADGYAFEQATNVRQAPSVTNPSMWRCVPGSSFYSPHQCNPGDRQYVSAFTPVPVDAPTSTGTTGTSTTPAGGGTGSGSTTGSGAGSTTGSGAAKPAKPVLSHNSLRSTTKRKVAVRIRCGKTKGSSSCKGTLTLKSGTRTLAKASFTIKAGRTTTVHVTLTKAAYALLTKRHSLRTTVTLKARDSAGTMRTVAARVTLKAPKA